LRVILRRLKKRQSVPMATATVARPQLLSQFRKRNVALGSRGRKNQLGIRLDPLRMAVTGLELGPNIALAPFLSPPPDRARRTHAKSLRRRATGQSALNRANDTPATVNG
jgi:hypothetical protein